MTKFFRSQSRRMSVRPTLEALEDRTVPSTLNLTARGSSGVINGAIFRQDNSQPAGTDDIASFVRIRAGGVEQGYNTNARPVQFDELPAADATHALHLSEVPLVTVGGTAYREFVLDTHQRRESPLLSLDELRLYVADMPYLRGYRAATHQLVGLNPVYDLDAGPGNNWIRLNADLNRDRSTGDMVLLVPASVFASANPNPYVYLYSKFGVHNDANGRFEQWGVNRGHLAPAPASLSGYVYADYNANGVRDPADDGPIPDVRITLTGTDDRGNSVTLIAITDSTGFYRFDNLRPGTYAITETQPDGYSDGADNLGSQGGSVANDQFFNIVLNAGINGINNNFGELLAGS